MDFDDDDDDDDLISSVPHNIIDLDAPAKGQDVWQDSMQSDFDEDTDSNSNSSEKEEIHRGRLPTHRGHGVGHRGGDTRGILI